MASNSQRSPESGSTRARAVALRASDGIVPRAGFGIGSGLRKASVLAYSEDQNVGIGGPTRSAVREENEEGDEGDFLEFHDSSGLILRF